MREYPEKFVIDSNVKSERDVMVLNKHRIECVVEIMNQFEATFVRSWIALVDKERSEVRQSNVVQGQSSLLNHVSWHL